jgi:hypothetical protein
VFPHVRSYSYHRPPDAWCEVTRQLDSRRARGPTEIYRYRRVKVSYRTSLFWYCVQGYGIPISTMNPSPTDLLGLRDQTHKPQITNDGSFDCLAGLEAHDVYRWVGSLSLCWFMPDPPIIQILEWFEAHSAIGGLHTLRVVVVTPSPEHLATITRCCPRLPHLSVLTDSPMTVEYDLSEACQILAPLRCLKSLELTCPIVKVNTTIDPPPATPSTLRSPVFPNLLDFAMTCPTPTPDDAEAFVSWSLRYIPKTCNVDFLDYSRRREDIYQQLKTLIEAGRNAAYENAFKDCTWRKLPSTRETM